MKELFIKRVSPSYGQVCAHTWNDQERIVTKIIPYQDCLNYVRVHQKDLTVYKVGYTSTRKNAKRKLLTRIFAESEEQAIKLFRGLVSSNEPGSYQLCTGDWKIINNIIKEN